MSFQGGDGYAFFATEELAFATVGTEQVPGIPDLMDTPMLKGQVRRILQIIDTKLPD